MRRSYLPGFSMAGSQQHESQERPTGPHHQRSEFQSGKKHFLFIFKNCKNSKNVDGRNLQNSPVDDPSLAKPFMEGSCGCSAI